MGEGANSVDWPVFQQLLEEVGPDAMSRLLATFAGEAKTRIARFAELSAVGGPLGAGTTLHREVHSLKSAAGSFGASALAAAAAELESAIKADLYRHDPAECVKLEKFFGEFEYAVATHRESFKIP
jgi:HPt (histidine-containing phosphotransfer) domain-containing protein